MADFVMLKSREVVQNHMFAHKSLFLALEVGNHT